MNPNEDLFEKEHLTSFELALLVDETVDGQKIPARLKVWAEIHLPKCDECFGALLFMYQAGAELQNFPSDFKEAPPLVGEAREKLIRRLVGPVEGKEEPK